MVSSAWQFGIVVRAAAYDVCTPAHVGGDSGLGAVALVQLVEGFVERVEHAHL